MKCFVFLETTKIEIMQEAAFTNLLRTIAIILLIWYVLKVLARIFFPMLMKKTMSTMEKRFRQQQEAQNPAPREEEIGKTIIDRKPNSKIENTEKNKGEFIDFEEVD